MGKAARAKSTKTVPQTSAPGTSSKPSSSGGFLHQVTSVFCYILPSTLLIDSLWHEPLRIKALGAALIALVTWGIIKLLAPALYALVYRRTAKRSFGDWMVWACTLGLGAIASAGLVTNLQVVQRSTENGAILFALIGFALEGATLQWLRWGQVALALPLLIIGRTALGLFVAQTVSATPLSTFFIVASVAACILPALLGGVALVEKNSTASISSPRLVTVLYLAGPTAISVIVYAGLLPSTFLLTLVAFAPMQRFFASIDGRSALTAILYRSTMLYLLAWFIVAPNAG